MLYDPEANILSWEIAKGKIDHANEVGNFIVHVSKAGKPILIEMLDASKFMGQYDKLKTVKELRQALPAA